MSNHINNNKDVEYHRGDVFYIANDMAVVSSEQRSSRPGIIVSNNLANRHSPTVSVVYLTSQKKKHLPTHVDVMCKYPSTALCEQIQTVSKERLKFFIKHCTTSEMKKIDKAICCALDLTIR